LASDQKRASEIGALPSDDRSHATVHGAYSPVTEPFGARLETFFIGLCVAIGDMDGKPLSVAKIAALYARADALQSYAGSLGCKVGV
jgi:hypothetical protein